MSDVRRFKPAPRFPPIDCPTRVSGALLLTDLVRSVELAERVADPAYRALRQRSVAIHETAIGGEPSGRVMRVQGDAYVALFDTAAAAARAALRIQLAFARQDWGGHAMAITLAVHAADYFLESDPEGKADLSDSAMNHACRLHLLALPGQILLNKQAYLDAKKELRAVSDGAATVAVMWATHGMYWYKGASDDHEVCEVGIPGVAPLRPPSATAKAGPKGAGPAADAQAAVPTPPPATNFPDAGRSYNRMFVGRVKKLGELHAALTTGRGAARPPAAITQGFAGEGGIGKSELAQRYAEDYAGHWDGLWWLDCSAVGHPAALAKLAGPLGVVLPPESPLPNDPTGARSSRAWLAAARGAIRRALSDGRRHLLVLDNLEPSDNPANAWDTLTELQLPGRCAVVVTTREQRLPRGLATVVRLGVLSDDDARALLLKRYEDEPPAWPAADLNALAAHFGYHALAIDLAAAWLYLNRGLSPAMLLDQIRASDEATLALFEKDEFRDDAHNYRVSVASTLALHMDSPALAAALPLLAAAAFVAPDRIPVPLLAAAAGLDEASAAAAVRALVGRSILSHESGSDGGLVAIHRLTQAVVRARGEVDSAGRVARVLDSLVAVFRRPTTSAELLTDQSRAPERLVAWPHAEAALSELDRGASSNDTKAMAASLHAGMAIWLRYIGQLKSALLHSDAAIALAEAQVPRDEHDLANHYAGRAAIRRDCHDLAGAESDIGRSISWGEAQEPRHEQGLAVWYAARANIRGDCGDLAGAETDIQASISWGETQAPHDQRELAIRYTVRARIWRDRGDLAGAEADLQRSIGWFETHAPGDGRAMALRHADLADILWRRNDLAGAEAYIQRSIAWGEAQVPRDEALLAFWQEHRSLIFARTGRFREARAAIDESVRLHTAAFGAGHEWTALTVYRQQAIHAGRVPG